MEKKIIRLAEVFQIPLMCIEKYPDGRCRFGIVAPFPTCNFILSEECMLQIEREDLRQLLIEVLRCS